MHAAPGTPFFSVTCWKCWQTGNKAVSCQLGHLLPKALQSHLLFISLALTNNLSVVQPITHRLASAQGVVQPALLVKAIRGHIRVGKCLLMCLSLWNAISPLGDEIALVPLVLEQHPVGLATSEVCRSKMTFLYASSGGTSKMVFNPLHWKGWISLRQIFSTILTAACKKGSFSPLCISEDMQSWSPLPHLIHTPTSPVQQGLHTQNPLVKCTSFFTWLF